MSSGKQKWIWFLLLFDWSRTVTDISGKMCVSLWQTLIYSPSPRTNGWKDIFLWHVSEWPYPFLLPLLLPPKMIQMSLGTAKREARREVLLNGKFVVLTAQVCVQCNQVPHEFLSLLAVNKMWILFRILGTREMEL